MLKYVIMFITCSFTSVSSVRAVEGYSHYLIPTGVTSYYWYDHHFGTPGYVTAVQFQFVDGQELRRLKEEAEAAVKKANALEQGKRLAVISKIALAEAEIGRLEKLLDGVSKQQLKLNLYAKAVSSLREGNATPENIEALRYFVRMHDDSLKIFSLKEIPEFDADQFVARGEFKWQADGKGNRLRVKNAVVAFEKSGQRSPNDLLDFLARERQNLRKDSPVSDLMQEMVDVALSGASKRFEELEDSKDMAQDSFNTQWHRIKSLTAELNSVSRP